MHELPPASELSRAVLTETQYAEVVVFNYMASLSGSSLTSTSILKLNQNLVLHIYVRKRNLQRLPVINRG